MKIIFPAKLYKKLRAYVEGIDYEISGFGKIELSDKKNEILVKDIKIFRQEVSNGHTVMKKKFLAKFFDQLMKSGEDLRYWKLWWHSHASMETFWSNTDVNTIEDFDNEMPQDNWMLSLVTNYEAEMKIRLDIFAPIRCTINKIGWDISLDDFQLEREVENEIIEKVKIFVPKKYGKEPKRTFWGKDGEETGFGFDDLEIPGDIKKWPSDKKLLNSKIFCP